MKRLLIATFLLSSGIPIAFGKSQLNKETQNTDSSHCTTLPIKLGVKIKTHKSTLYNGKRALYKHRFVSQMSVFCFAEWRAAKSWGIELFGGGLMQGMDTGKQRLIRVTEETKQGFRIINKSTSTKIGKRAILIPYTIVGIAPRFYQDANGILSWFIGPWVGYRDKIDAPLMYGFEHVPEKSQLETQKEACDYENVLKKHNWGILLGLAIDLEMFTVGIDANIGLMNITKMPARRFYTFSINGTVGCDFVVVGCYWVNSVKNYIKDTIL